MPVAARCVHPIEVSANTRLEHVRIALQLGVFPAVRQIGGLIHKCSDHIVVHRGSLCNSVMQRQTLLVLQHQYQIVYVILLHFLG